MFRLDGNGLGASHRRVAIIRIRVRKLAVAVTIVSGRNGSYRPDAHQKGIGAETALLAPAAVAGKTGAKLERSAGVEFIDATPGVTLISTGSRVGAYVKIALYRVAGVEITIVDDDCWP